MTFALVGSLAILANIGDRQVAPGELAPNLRGVEWLQGPPVAEFTPGRIYVVEFWSTWCAACITSIETTNDLAKRYESRATFVAVHIWHRPPSPKPADFLAHRRKDGKPVPEFAVAEDVSGVIAESWMDATQSSGLPTAMLIDGDSRLVWLGDSRTVEGPLRQLVQGEFDVANGVAAMKNRIRAGELANESSRAIESGDYPLGAKLALEALKTDPEAAAPWMPGTYGFLLAASRSTAVADGFARELLATDAGKQPDVLANLAYVILHFEPRELRNLQFALEVAGRAQQSQSEPDADLIVLIARLRVELGDRAGAINELETAMHTVDADGRKAIEKTLNELKSVNR